MTEEPDLQRKPNPNKLLFMLFIERIAEKPLAKKLLTQKTLAKKLFFKKDL